MSALRFKPGVTLTPHPAGARLIGALDRVARSWPTDLTITCGSDSHPPGTVHTLGKAFDVRTHGLTDDEKAMLLRGILTDLADVIDDPIVTLPIGGIWLAQRTRIWFGQVEFHGAPNEHLHCQLRQRAVFPPV